MDKINPDDSNSDPISEAQNLPSISNASDIHHTESGNNNITQEPTVNQSSSSSVPGKDVTDSSSNTDNDHHAPIDSEILLAIDQYFGEIMREDKNLQRVDSTPGTIPRYFVVGKKIPSYGMMNPRLSKDAMANIQASYQVEKPQDSGEAEKISSVEKVGCSPSASTATSGNSAITFSIEEHKSISIDSIVQVPLDECTADKDNQTLTFHADEITSSVNKYIDSLEEEWKIRRKIWLDNNKHNPNWLDGKTRVYQYETFRECMANCKINEYNFGQVPFELPDVEEYTGNPVLKDEISPTRKSSSKEPLVNPEKQREESQILKLNVVGGGSSSGSLTNQNVNSFEEEKQVITNNNGASVNNDENNPSFVLGGGEIQSEDEEQDVTSSSSLDYTPFVNQCGGILDELKTINRRDQGGDSEELAQAGTNRAKKINEIVGIVSKEYIDFLEGEWKKRRGLWMEQNIRDDNMVYQSVKTFREGVSSQQVELQVPFDLPDVLAERKTISTDQILEYEKLFSDITPVEESPPPQDQIAASALPSSQLDEVVDKVESNNKVTVPDSIENQNQEEAASSNEQPKQVGSSWWPSFFTSTPVETPKNTAELESVSKNDSDTNLERKDGQNEPKEDPLTNIDNEILPLEQRYNNNDPSLAAKLDEKDTAVPIVPVDTVLLQYQENSDGVSDLIKADEQIQKMEAKMASVDDNDDEEAVLEPFIEIYRGLSREDTSNSLKGTKPPTEHQAFVNGRTVMCKSLEQKTRLDICCMKLNTVQTYAANLKDMTALPGIKILLYLSLEDYKNCRLVSKSWNNAVITLKKFLDTTTFVVEKKPLGALAALEASRVRWQHLRCSILPSMNFTTATSYNGRFLSSNLRVTPMSSRNVPVTCTLTTVIFQNLDIHKQQFGQWIQNCKRICSIDLQHCNFIKTTISLNMDKTNRVLERIQVLKFSDMDSVKLAEALRFFLPATRRLHTLEIIQQREAKGGVKSTSNITRKGVEDDIASVLCPALKKNSSSLKNIRFELSSSKNYLLQTKIIETFQNTTFELNSFIVRSFSHLKAHPCYKLGSYGSSSKNLMALLKNSLIKSKEMTLLDFPMLSVDFVNGESHLLSPKLEKLGVQLEMPDQETKLNLDVTFPHLSQLDLYGNPLQQEQWFNVRETMPKLTQLVVFSAGIRNSHIQAIIRSLKLLQVLRLENVQDVTDFGITGMEQGWIDRLKMYWPEKADSNTIATSEQFSRDKIRFAGKSLSSLSDLHTFVMKGDFDISNVGILYGFHSRELRTLELCGSPVHASNSGIFILGFQCPHLRRVRMVVQHTKVNLSGIRKFCRDLLEDKGPDASYQIDLLPSLNLQPSNEMMGEQTLTLNY